MPSEKMYYHKFVVAGQGEFPYDMLRRDQCFPFDTESAMALRHDVSYTRRVTLCSWSNRKNWFPNHLRWESFGWSVIKIIVEM